MDGDRRRSGERRRQWRGCGRRSIGWTRARVRRNPRAHRDLRLSALPVQHHAARSMFGSIDGVAIACALRLIGRSQLFRARRYTSADFGAGREGKRGSHCRHNCACHDLNPLLHTDLILAQSASIVQSLRDSRKCGVQAASLKTGNDE
jgi:hypothetical protein